MLTWTAEEASVFTEAARTNRLWPLWELALTTGMRQGELLGLRWGDINFEERTLWVRQAVYRGWVGEPKTASGVRSIPLLPAVLESLREHRRHQNERRLKAGPDWEDNDLVICTQTGGVYGHTNVNMEHEKIMAQVGVTRIRFHDLRHTYATLALSAGIPAHVVSAILGHANIKITLNTYAHVLPTQYEDVRERLELLLYPSRNGAM
jgi:integrase